MTIFQDKLLTRKDYGEAGDYVVPNVLSPRDLVFRPDIGHKTLQSPPPFLIIVEIYISVDFGLTTFQNKIIGHFVNLKFNLTITDIFFEMN